MFVLVGFLAFALTTLYREMDIAEGLRTKVGAWLAHKGWSEILNARDQPVGLKPRKRRGFWRFVWQLQDCPYCLSTWAAFGATWYALSIHPWHRVFWLVWWSAVGVAWLVVAAYKTAQSLIEELGARVEERHAHDG